MKVKASQLAQPEVLSALFSPCRLWKEVLDHPGRKYVPDDHPTRNQRSFHESTQMHRVLLGGNQSGKSKAAAHEIKWWATGMHPHQEVPPCSEIWVVSASYATIENGIWSHLQEILPEWEIKKRGQQVPHTSLPSRLELNNGSVIKFISGSGASVARRKVQAARINLFAIDEEVDDLVFKELNRRLLAKGGSAIYSLTAVESVDWILELERRNEEGDSNVFLARLDTRRAAEAGHVDKGVLTDLMSSSSEEENKIRVQGHTMRRHGLVYPEWTDAHICDPFPIPKDWPRYMAMDPGHHCFAVLWVAVSPNDKVYAYRELYEHAKNSEKIADMVYAAEGWTLNQSWTPGSKDDADYYDGKWIYDAEKTEQVVVRWCDPAEFGVNPGGSLKVGNMLSSDYGMACAPAINDVEVGIEMVKRSLMEGFDGTPRFQCFSTLSSFLRERSRYRRRSADTYGLERNERKADPVKKNDHLMDTWRYLMVGGFNYEAGDEKASNYEESSIPRLVVGPDGSTGNARVKASWDKLMSEMESGPRGGEDHWMGGEF